MRCARLAGLVLVTLTLAGCLHDRAARSSSFLDRFRGTGPTGPDAVAIEYAVIERPVGSAAIDRDVWGSIDEMGLPSETRALLQANGFRVGVVGELLPTELEQMLANPKSVTGHRERRLYVNNPATFTINGPVASAEYEVKSTPDGTPTTVHFEQARFAITVTPAHGPEGHITLKCVPEVEYQDKKHWLPPGAVGLGWTNSKPIEKYAGLGWEVTLSRRAFLVIGTNYDRGALLGNQTFTGTRGADTVQRLLILRVSSLATHESGPDLMPPEKVDVVPIASQAGIAVARGSRP